MFQSEYQNCPVGAVVPLPHVGPERCGVVVQRSWSEALGMILRVREDRAGGSSTMLVYGNSLALIVAALAVPAT